MFKSEIWKRHILKKCSYSKSKIGGYVITILFNITSKLIHYYAKSTVTILSKSIESDNFG